MKHALVILILFTGWGSTLSAETRDPFWPVGYEPQARLIRTPEVPQTGTREEDGENVTAEVAGETGDLSASEKAVVTSKLRPGGYLQRGDTRYLYINGEMLTVGEKLIITHNGKKHAFMIEKFKERSVVMNATWNFTATPTSDSEQ